MFSFDFITKNTYFVEYAQNNSLKFGNLPSSIFG